MRWRRLLVVLALAAAGGCSTCDGEGVDRLRAELTLSDERLTFDDTLLGGSSLRTLMLTNTGGAPTTVDMSIELAIEDGGETFVIREPDSPLEVAAGEMVQIVLRFRPASTGSLSGTLTLSPTEDDIAGASVALVGLGVDVPICDDDNPCTDDVFEPAGETCVHLAHDRACTPDNQCLRDARCVEGACVGTTVTCAPSTSPCREAICDPDRGCVEIELAGVCVDDDPCTLDACTDDGCTFEPAPDYQPCGELVTCVSADVCLDGACTSVPIPEGAPCDDELLCTQAVCTGGACIGAPAEGEPTLLSSLQSFAGAESTVVEVSGGRLLVFDPQLRTDFSVGRGDLTVLGRNDGGVWIIEEQIDVAPDRFSAIADGTPLSDWFLAGRPFTYDKVARVVGSDVEIIELPDAFEGGALIADELLACQSSNDILRRFSLSAEGAVELPPLLLDGSCGAMVLLPHGDSQSVAVWVFTSGGSAMLQLYDAPSFGELVPSSSHSVGTSGFLGGGPGYAVFSELPQPNTPGDQGTVRVLDLNVPADLHLFTGPFGLPNPGHPIVADDQLWVRWGAEPADHRSQLYQKAVTGADGWAGVPYSPWTRFNAPAPLIIDELVVQPGFVETATSLMALGPSGLAMLPLPQQRGGQLVRDGPRLLTIASDRLATAGPLTDTLVWNLEGAIPADRRARLVWTDDGAQLVDPAALADPEIPAPLRLDSGSLFGIRLDGEDLVSSLHGGPVPPDPFGAVFDLFRSGAVSGDQLVTVAALNRFAASGAVGPLVLSTYTMVDPYADGAWQPLAELTLIDDGINAGGPIAIAASGDRAAVLTPQVQGMPSTLFLIDIGGPAPTVLATRVDNDGGEHHLAVAGDLVLRQPPQGVGVLYQRDNDLLLPIGNTVALPSSPKPLAFDGEVLLLAGDTGLHYYGRQEGDLVNFTPTFTIELGERPIDLEEIGGLLYVTTERGLHVVSPPCPGPDDP